MDTLTIFLFLIIAALTVLAWELYRASKRIAEDRDNWHKLHDVAEKQHQGTIDDWRKAESLAEEYAEQAEKLAFKLEAANQRADKANSERIYWQREANNRRHKLGLPKLERPD